MTDSLVTHDKNNRKLKKNKNLQGKLMFLYILPFLLISFAFSYYPLHGWIYAFYDYRPPLKLSQSEFVGLQWFKMLFSNATQMKLVAQVMINTFVMSGLTLATAILPVFFAIFLSEIKCKWLRKFIQTFTTVPNFISWVMVYSVAYSLFSGTGMINTFLMKLNLIFTPVKFLDSDSHTWLAMLLWYTWKSLGWGSIMYLAAIAGVDQELYEAAKVDGANRFKLMRHITFPALLPTFFVILMLSVANFLNNGLDQYYVFQNAFNKEHIQVLDLYVYNVGMTGGSPSLATAIGMLKSIVSVTLLFAVNQVSKKVRGESII
ncbi:putative aldouronate transport system permease protein [Anaerocolumna jejuensis DSM 15929]|uniref:Putative aldouronate transport system permease protein n=1 Tax=Anaerocolumna jejuensis DSM 15929 TaxID=1121322 RepID=A0A1M7CJ13_9FIRM|nr:ABC transporter permease subunit [Anaerocolumna jejuensis]SHL67147.1 putative aldouronate transport system permease protein [Anaerocolumna jejuensis DSM 15929]